MAARVTRRLPGFKFEVRSPQLDERLPRMDIAVFAGFAASGPLHTPVAIEDVDQFAEIFGEDAPLAWDVERCRQVYAHLGPAVRSFFRNGGRRCWVIRVASDDAAYNYFAIPGLARTEVGSDGRVRRVGPALARARSEGSWADSLRVSSALVSRPFETTSIRRGPVELDGVSTQSLVIELDAAAGDIEKGDLLRLTFGDETVAMVVADSVAEALNSPPSDRTHLVVSSTRELWLKPFPSPAPPGLTPASARVFLRVIAGGAQRDDVLPTVESEEIEARISWPSESREELEVFLLTSAENAPPAGSLIRLRAGADDVLMNITDSGSADIPGFGRAVRLTGGGSLVMPERQALPIGLPVAEILEFEMWVRREADEATQMTGLAFNSPHDRFWGDLPVDHEFYSQTDYSQQGGATEPGRVALAFEKQKSDLGQESRALRFPLAGAGPATAIYFPSGMGALPLQYLGRLDAEELPLERDGLSEFDANLFLDPELVETGTTSFSEQADFLRYLSPNARRLRGVHAAFGIEEATIIAVPDAIQRGWRRTKELPEPVAEPSRPIARPEWLHYRDCKVQEESSPPATPELGYFLCCDAVAPDPPSLSLSDPPDGTGTFTIQWVLASPPSSPPGFRFILEQSTRADFSDGVVIYQGRDESLVVFGRAPGEYYYRVRIEHGENTSNWSNGIGVRVSGSRSYELVPIKAYSAQTVLAVQRALLRMGAARGDLFAVLSMPEHYREDEAQSHVKTLKSETGAAIEVNASFRVEVAGGVERRQVRALSLPLSAGEAGDFSHGAIYHPWLIGGQQRDRFSASPPDGEACGVIAARALNRGAWIAPANEAMSGLVALNPQIKSERWLDLQESRINIVRQDPRGFMAMSADTLSDDDDLRPINVRRLLSLLRRLALRLGASYVFEPNDGAFRRMVQRGFEAMLGQMFVRGAFAGATPQTSFQVVTGDGLNTPQSVEQGRFIVELRVAPSLPMTFMTVRLVQTGDRSLVLEAR